MTPVQLDFWFPFVVLGYGLIVTASLNLPRLNALAETRLSLAVRTQWRAHRGLALACVIIGVPWALENLWLV